MPIVKTELEWRYRPADLFEAPYHWQTDDYTLVANAGTVLVTLATPSDPIDARLQSHITKKVEGLFLARQLLVHRTFELESVRVCHHRSDGGKERSVSFTAKLSLTAAAFEHLSVSEQPDVVIHNASETVVQDSKSKRIIEHTTFIDSITPKLSRSGTLNALFESYNAVVSHPANELVHLYEIRDALATHYGGDAEARRKLRITEKDWKRLGNLANDAPLKEGRHRGKHSKLRHATAAELDEARKITRDWIKAFANQL
jgi:hypothetical protein